MSSGAEPPKREGGPAMTTVTAPKPSTPLRLSVRLATSSNGRSQTVSLNAGAPVRVKLAA